MKMSGKNHSAFDSKSDSKSFSFLALALCVFLYTAVYIVLDRLNFPIQKDELHFWPTSLFFSHSFPPSLNQLHSYQDLSTPLPFVIFGALEFFFHKGIWLGRVANFLLSFFCLLPILFARRKPVNRRTLFCALGLLLCPYFLGVSCFLYTDLFAIFFVLMGMVAYTAGSPALSCVAFLLAISSRQYAVVFPASLAVWGAVSLRGHGQFWRRWQEWGFPLLSAASLTGWFLFFGGPGPRGALASQFVATSGTWSLLPQNMGYFLACVGLYYVIPETLLFSSSRDSFKKKLRDRKLIVALLLTLLGFFALFPPMGNPEGYPFREMGYFDKTLRLVFSDCFRIGAIYLFACLAVVRFFDWTLAGLLTIANALIMTKAHIAWDKYTLPLLAALWFLKAVESQDCLADQSILNEAGKSPISN